MSATNEKMRWDLESIFPGGASSGEFREFRSDLSSDLKEAQSLLDNLPAKLDGSTRDRWMTLLSLLQSIAKKIEHASGFTSCLVSQDVNDDRAHAIRAEIDDRVATWQTMMTRIEALAAQQEDQYWSSLLETGELAGSRFFWEELRQNARQKMDPAREAMAVELAVNGYHAWNRLYDKMAGDLRADFSEDGTTKTLSIGQLYNKLNLPDRATREQAFDGLLEAWRPVESLAAMALNAQAGFRLSLYKMRGWESPLHEALMNGRLQRKTVDAMWEAIEKSVASLAPYIEAKKKLMDIDEFRWYDQFSPIGRADRTISYDEAGDFIVKHLGSFSRNLGEFARMAIDKRWIEAEDRPGKAQGGFCTGLDMKNESRIFMTYSETFSELLTLAHELGHAYHSWVLKDKDFFATQYPMNLAETASIFNELLVIDAAYEESDDPAEQLRLLDQKLQQAHIFFCDIRCRYLFDSTFYEERKNGVVQKDRLNELMTEAQRTAYAGTLSDDGYHKLFWATKLHFFITDMPFYNFPYTFGFLFAGGVYDRARQEGQSFADKYDKLLADTGSMRTEELAKKHLGVDLTSPDFWETAVTRTLADVDRFVTLAETVGAEV